MEKKESKTKRILRSPKTHVGLSLVIASLNLIYPQISNSGCAGPNYGDCDNIDGNYYCVSGSWDFWDDCAPGY